ncbi:unnamed protein product [Paramecium pentaurelia]|uniref:Uncharacterized protein n=1 Tax=Paramecium pentaurelia TaxID=43138 RepID=A0A8S1YD23_9CILI|nr:unnamed protein product [Paramecium pentaurelia]
MQDRQREFTIDFSDFQGSYLIYMEEAPAHNKDRY